MAVINIKLTLSQISFNAFCYSNIQSWQKVSPYSFIVPFSFYANTIIIKALTSLKILGVLFGRAYGIVIEISLSVVWLEIFEGIFIETGRLTEIITWVWIGTDF